MNCSPDPLRWLDASLQALDDASLRRTLTTRASGQGAEIELDGRKLLNFGSNDYLGLAADQRLAKRAIEAIQSEGWGAGASPLITGHGGVHRELERRLAQFEGTEAALVFPSGFAANVGTIAALVERGDAVFGDSKNHASIIDGCRLSRADVHVYQHADPDHLETLLRSNPAYRRRLIVTDSLFSMDGNLAPLDRLADLAEQYDCMLLVDEAHATGVFGAHGRGICELLGLEDRVHIRVGTLSKAFGCAGGFVIGSCSLIDWLVNRARPYVFSTAHPAAGAAAAIAALEIVQSEPQRRAELLDNARYVRQQLTRQGWNCGAANSQIIPIYIGAPERTMQLAAQLRERGLLIPGIRPPSVPAGESLLRISLAYGHTRSMLDRLLNTLDELRTI